MSDITLTSPDGERITLTDTPQVDIVLSGGLTGPTGSQGLPGGVLSVNGQTGVAVLTKTDVGLGNVDNTSNATERIAVRALSGITQLDVDNLRLDGNTISTTNTNGDINLTPNGAGKIMVPNDTSVQFGGGSGGNNTSLKTGTDGTFLFDTGGTENIKFKGTDGGGTTMGYTDGSFNYVWRTDSSGNSTQSGTATVATPTASGHATTKAYVDSDGTLGLTTDLSATMTTLQSHIPSTLGTGTDQNYRAPTEAEVRAVIKGLRQVTKEAGKDYANIDLTDATTTLSTYGFTLSKGYDSTNRRPYALVQAEYTYPASANFRAWGNFFFDLSRPTSVFIEAPHPQTDGNSEVIALRTWQSTPGAVYTMSSVNRKAKDYMLAEIYTDATGGTFTLTFRSQTTTALAYNASPATVQAALEALSSIGTGKVICTGDNVNTSLHCFANLDPTLYSSGTPTDTITGSGALLTGTTVLSIDHDADAAHNYNSIFNKLAQDFATQGYAQLQLHGYSDVSSGVPRIFNAILSKGSSNNTKLIEVVRTALEANGFDVGTKDSFSTQGLYVTGAPTGGSIVLTYNSVATGAIAYSATPATFAASVQAALEAHANIGTGNVSVTQSTNTNTGVSQALVITFKGTLYHLGLTAITVTTNSLTGGTTPTASGLTAEGTALTAQSNTQGDIAEVAGTVFMHLEMSDTVRSSTTLSARIVAALGNLNLPQLSAAALPVLAESGHTTSQAPLVNGSGATIGTSLVAARSDHRHPATSNTPSTADFIIRGAGSWTAVSPAGAKTSLALVSSDVGLGSVTNDAQLKIASNLSDLANATTARTNLGLGTIATLSTITLTTNVTGILPVANGGTGSATQNFIDLTTDQTAAGIKSFQTDASGNGVQIIRASSTTSQEAKLGLRVSSTANNTSNMAEVVAIRTDAPSSQDTALVFRNRRSGAAASEVGRFDANGSLQVLGFKAAISTKTANYTLTGSDYTVLFDATSGSLTATLPAAASFSGQMYVIKKIDASVNTVTIDGNASETIDGATTKVISTQYNSFTIHSNGTSWFIV